MHFPGVVRCVQRRLADAGKARIRVRGVSGIVETFHERIGGHKQTMLILLLVIILILAVGGGIFVSKLLFLLLLLLLLLALFRGRF